MLLSERAEPQIRNQRACVAAKRRGFVADRIQRGTRRDQGGVRIRHQVREIATQLSYGSAQFLRGAGRIEQERIDFLRAVGERRGDFFGIGKGVANRLTVSYTHLTLPTTPYV